MLFRSSDDADAFGISHSGDADSGYTLQLRGAENGFSARVYPCEKAGSLVQADFHSGKLYLLVPAGGLASEKCSPSGRGGSLRPERGGRKV